MANVGYATLQIIPSMRGVDAAMRQQLVGPSSAAGVAAGQGFGSKFAEGARNLIAPVGRAIGELATGVTIAAGGLVAASLFKGWDRLTTIQDSTRTLTIQLGDATEAATLLDRVLGIVKGTPFALDLFASAAANLVAMGVSAQKVPGYLTAIGEASATKGARANEFAQSLAETFGRVSAQGRIMGQDVNNLASTGVNALAILANHFGITTDEMRGMIFEGAIPAGEALDALAKGIIEGSDGVAGATVALGGTMAGLGKELSGSASNFSIAMARFGAAIIAPFSPALIEGFGIASKLFDTLGARASALAKTLVESPGFARFLDWLRGLPDQIGPLLDKLSDLRGIVVPLGAAFAALGAGGLSRLLGPFGALIPAINPVLAAFAALVVMTPELRDAFVEVFKALEPPLRLLAGALGQALTRIIDALRPSLPDVSKALVAMAVAVGQLVVALVPLIPPLTQLAVVLITQIGIPVILGIAQAFTAIVTAIAGSPAAVYVLVGAFVALKLAMGVQWLIAFATNLMTVVIPSLIATATSTVTVGLALQNAVPLIAAFTLAFIGTTVILDAIFGKAKDLTGALADLDEKAAALATKADAQLAPAFDKLILAWKETHPLAAGLTITLGAFTEVAEANLGTAVRLAEQYKNDPVVYRAMQLTIARLAQEQQQHTADMAAGADTAGVLATALSKIQPVSATVTIDTSQAVQALADLSYRYSLLTLFQQQQADAVALVSGFTNIPEFASGGYVPGPQGQAVPAIIHAGEYVLTAAQVNAIRKGMTPSGGSTTGVNVENINVQVPADDPLRTATGIARELRTAMYLAGLS